MIRINFFLNTLSIHQAPLIRKLSSNSEYLIRVFYEKDLSQERRNLGWYEPNFGNCKVYCLRDLDVSKIISTIPPGSINIFSGISTYPKIYKIFKKAILTDTKNYVQMESVNEQGFKGYLRKIKYRLLAFKYNKHLSGILSQGGKQQFERMGFKKVYDFAYFIDSHNEVFSHVNLKTRFIYLGALSKRKQIYKLISAIPVGSELSLDIYGSEEDIPLDSIITLIEKHENIEYKGVLRNSDIIKTLITYDYLILPSKSEGWGAVVAEALLSGIGVVVTDVAGIVNYIDKKFSNNIYIVDFSDMSKQVDLIQTLKPLTPYDRTKLKLEAHCLSSDFGSRLFIDYVI